LSSPNLNLLYGSRQHPYYIYVPRWITSSAGIKAQHYLCHALNNLHQNAFLVFSEGMHDSVPRVNPHLKTPILTSEIAEAFMRAGIEPIAIYSETIPDNPLNANFVVRYLMNYAGVLGGKESFSDAQYVIAFSKKIAEDYASRNKVEVPSILFLPPIDPRDFNKVDSKSNLQLIYAGKYRSFVGKPPKIGRRESIEIFRDGPNMQSREEVIQLLQKAEIVYSFENSSITTEAVLSGTPAYFVPNEFLGEVIAEHELGLGGIVLEDSELGIERARKTISEGIENYYNQVDYFFSSLQKFIEISQNKVAEIEVLSEINLPNQEKLINAHRIKLAIQILRTKGFLTLLRVTYHFILRRLSWRFWLANN